MTAIDYALKTTAAVINFLLPTQSQRDRRVLALGASLRQAAMECALPVKKRNDALDRLAELCNRNLANQELAALTFDALFRAASDPGLTDTATTWRDILRRNEHQGHGRGYFEACCASAHRANRHARFFVPPR